MIANFTLLLSLLNFVSDISTPKNDNRVNDVVVVSVATEETDGYKRFVRSLQHYNLKYEIFGMGQKWNGGNMKTQPGGGQKVNILKKELEKYKDDTNKIIIYTDSYDVIFANDADYIIQKFKEFNANIVFGAENACWPDPSLAEDYPRVGQNEKRFLNSGGFIGYASFIYKIITIAPIKDKDDDQLFYTAIFLNKSLRDDFKIKLDTRSLIFQNLNGALNEIKITEFEDEFKIFNVITETKPSIIHGNGPSKINLNRLGNYIPNSYSCASCKADAIRLDKENQNEWPNVTIGIFIEEPVPFLREFFVRFSNLNYPKSKISLLIHNNVKYHKTVVEKFLTQPNNDFKSIKYISHEDELPELEVREEALQEAIMNKCQYFFILDAHVHLDNSDTLVSLIEQNRDILSPVMTRKYSSWSNVWGAISSTGYYARSEDYFEIIDRKRIGIWNLPFVSGAILIKGDVLTKLNGFFEYTGLDPMMAFSKNLRTNDIFMYGTNKEFYGHLVNQDSFNTSLIRPEMYQIFENFDDWKNRYINPLLYDYISGKEEFITPCPDVYWFPVVTDEFCQDLIAMMEDFGMWSGGKNNHQDPRIAGGYENVPTVDIHMTQIGWNSHWLFFLKHFIMPIQQKVFIGYHHDPPKANLNFVVRYKVGEQENLKPHHDASTYTLNIALNRVDEDYQGGGCRFVRHNCSVQKTKMGWGMIHPGRLTHYHEGLKISSGTRYIMVSFIDP